VFEEVADEGWHEYNAGRGGDVSRYKRSFRKKAIIYWGKMGMYPMSLRNYEKYSGMGAPRIRASFASTAGQVHFILPEFFSTVLIRRGGVPSGAAVFIVTGLKIIPGFI